MNCIRFVIAICLFCNLHAQEGVFSAYSPIKKHPSLDLSAAHNKATMPLWSQGDDPLTANSSQAYNFPAAVRLADGYNGFTTLSYIFWNIAEDGLDLATTATFLSSTTTVVPSNGVGQTLFQNFDYTSGFQLGGGYTFSADHWVLRAAYTFLSQNKTTSHSAPDSATGVGCLYLTGWFVQTSSAGQSLAASSLSSKWHLGLDWFDVAIERPFYSGRKLTLTPFMGLRASWIQQSLQIHANSVLNVTPTTSMVKSHNYQNSWGLGPRGGFAAEWLFGAGWRLLGKMGGSLLFTQYPHVKHSEDSFISGGSAVACAFYNYNCLRPMLETNLGFGWGMYLQKHRYHLGFQATYDWNYLWSQNMLRVLNDQWTNGTGASASSLSLQGLTIASQFDF